MLDVTKYPPSAHGFTCRNCGGGDRGRVAIYRPFGEVSLSLNRTVTCMVLKANDRRTSCPCHDEFRGPRSDYVRQVAPELQRRMRTGIYLAVTAKRNRRSTASDLSRQLSSATGTTVLRQTVFRRLGHIDLYALRPSDSHRTLIWRASRTRCHQENTIERYRYSGTGWLVWGGFILGSRADLHVQSITMTGHIYRDVILEQHVRLFRCAMGAEFLFMDDNAIPHHANIVDECLQSEDITRLDRPAYSLDLNPVEHVWDILGRRIAALQPPPTCLLEIRRALLDEWCNISQDQIDNLIFSMPGRCKACIASSGRHTPY
ncbi:transposable element Tc3 transposase [Trichonephila clavipes]|nr:transposable element Tc3 transposase [Trichonephila clavipes]